METEHLRYPIGRFSPETTFLSNSVFELADILEDLPTKIRSLTKFWTTEDWNREYRPGGWTCLQVVHHLADSHINSFVRFKLALTEETPVIKPYEEAKWAELPDATEGTDPEDSLMLLDGLHRRWGKLVRSLALTDFQKAFFHPEHQKEITLLTTLRMYAWHSEHHFAHLKQSVEVYC